MGDPNFDRTVVLLALHSEEGALGFVVNRAAPLTLGELLIHAGYSSEGTDPTPVWVGGPVQPQSAWVLADDPALEASEGVIEVGSRLRITSSRSQFDRLAAESAARAAGEPDPQRRMVMLGYSGWGPEQLEGEIAQGAWLPVELDESILFDVAAEDRWEKAYALLGLTPADVMSMRGIGQA